MSDINVGDTSPSLGLAGEMWNVVKDMFTFSYDFGIEDDTGSYILNFFLFYAPLVGVMLSIYVLIRG